MSNPPRYRPSLRTAERLAAALAGTLTDRRITRVWRPSAYTLTLGFSQVKERLVVDVTPDHPHLRLSAEWPPSPARPDRLTLVYRQALEGCRITGVTCDEARILTLHARRGEGSVALRVQLAGRHTNVSVLLAPDLLPETLRPRCPAIDLASPPLPEGDVLFADAEDWMARFDLFLRTQVATSETHAAWRVLVSAARTLDKRAARTLRQADSALARVTRAEADLRFGELLKQALHQVHEGAEDVTVIDYTTGEAERVVVPLDPQLTAIENMQRYFKRYRKYESQRKRITAQHRDARTRAEATKTLRDALQALGQTSFAREALAPLKAQLEGLGWRPPRDTPPPKKTRRPAAPLPYRSFSAADETVIWLGRSARHNDVLTFQHARGNDIWLHTRDAPGSHVILRATKGQPPSSDALLDAAILAAWHSKLRGEAIIDVMWTERKHVKKPKGAPAGLVSVATSRTVAVRADPERLARISATERRD